MKSIKQGKKSILFLRRLADAKTVNGEKLAFQVEHTIDYGVEIESFNTKDGNVPSATDGETTISVTSYAYNEDGSGRELWKKLRDYALAHDEVEIWDVDVDTGGPGEDYEIRYFQGLLGSFSEPKTSEGAIELSFDITVKGYGVDGEETLEQSELDAIESTLYEYQSIKALGEDEE